MRNILPMLLILVAACTPARGPEPEPLPPPGPDPRTADVERVRQELYAVEGDLHAVRMEREDWSRRPPSEEKIRRMEDLGRHEQDLLRRRDELNAEMAWITGGPAPSAPATGLDALSALDTMEEAARAQETERARWEETARLRTEEAERMRRERATLEASGRTAGNRTGTIFEERWADVLLHIKSELHRYRRW